MPQLSLEDRSVIKACYLEKGWGGKRICKEFAGKKWNVGTVNRLIQKIVQTGSINRRKGSGRPLSACTTKNVKIVEEMILSQEDKPGSHKSAGRLAKELDISKRTVRRISKRAGLKNYKRERSVTIPPATKQR